MRLRLAPLLFPFLLSLPAISLADPASLQRCRAIADAAARLACYDAIPVSPAGAAPAPKSAGAVAPSAAAQAKVPSPADQFGLEARRAPDVPNAIESNIPGRFEGWRANQRIALANGQVWQISDGSEGALWLENPKVRIRRGMLGAFFLEIEGTNRSPRVVRLK